MQINTKDMGKKSNFTTLDRVLSKLYRDLGLEEISETDVIEWVGEAMEFMTTSSVLEEAVSLVEIKNHQGDLPFGLINIIQVARDNVFQYENACDIKEKEKEVDDTFKKHVKQTVRTFSECTECNETTTTVTENFWSFGMPINDMEKFLSNVRYKERYTPVRLSNHSFFNTLVCQEDATIYKSCIDEYTLVSNNKIRTSFKEGFLLISYYRIMLDCETGYPYIPDDAIAVNAITYYVTWKYMQKLWYMGREGYADKVQYSEERWLKYCQQYKSSQIMPETIDEHQNILEATFEFIPDRKKYYSFFKTLGREQRLNFRENGATRTTRWI